jgi:hypothetical protein
MKHQASIEGIVLGFLALAFLPPLPVIAVVLAVMGFTGYGGGEVGFATMALALGVSYLGFSALICFIWFGPVWAIMHRLGRNGRKHAFIAAFVSFTVALGFAVIFQAKSQAPGVEITLRTLATAALPALMQGLLYGVVAAFIAWRLVYRPCPPEAT